MKFDEAAKYFPLIPLFVGFTLAYILKSREATLWTSGISVCVAVIVFCCQKQADFRREDREKEIQRFTVTARTCMIAMDFQAADFIAGESWRIRADSLADLSTSYQSRGKANFSSILLDGGCSSGWHRFAVGAVESKL